MSSRASLCILLTLIAHGSVSAKTICLIDRVKNETEGVRVFFDLQQSVNQMVFGDVVPPPNASVPPREFRIMEGLVHWSSGDIEPGMLLKPHESASLIFSVESGCKIRFDEQSGVRGVTAESSVSSPTSDYSRRVIEFIRAE